MALQLDVSNSLEMLADTLLDKMRQSKRSVFTPITIVTQTEGINLWLREYIAKKIGIAANINFITPNDIVFRIFQTLGGVYKETISRESLIWILYKVMGEKEFETLFPEQHDYFQTPYSERDRKRMGMATKVADLFDQYQIYRQEVIVKWNNTPFKSHYEAAEWQEYLWKRVKTETPKDIQDKTLVKEFIDKEIHIQEKQTLLRKAIPEIYLFGLSIFTNYHLDILKRVASWVQVYFFLLNPAPQIYWMDDASDKQVARWRSHRSGTNDLILIGNPLLTNLGKVLQNTFRLLFRSEDLINQYNDEHVAIPRQDTLLHKLQANIFHNNVKDNILLSEKDLLDETLSIHSCYTIAAEVEALYHYLVHLVDYKKNPLSARDISVMVSDIDKYEPYIRAVFDNAPYSFKYKIADVSVVGGDTIYNALRLLLELNEQEFTSENVLQLLESSYIRKRFMLGNVDEIRLLIKEANIRFGIEGEDDDDTYIVSWQYGIQRLMYGICMSGEILMEQGDHPFYPLDIVEGGRSQNVVRFCHFIKILIEAMRRRHVVKTPTEWIDYVQWLIENLVYQITNNLDEDYYELKEHLSLYNDLNSIQLEAVPFDVFRLHFLSSLDATKRSSLFINDGITFCSLIPMRSVPFKVIAMLGMNAKDFPRREKPLSFSMLQQSYQLGDRNIKDNDKHLFLETLISAKDYLYISYIGRSVKDNTILPPSVLLEELIDYIQILSMGLKTDAAKAIITQHPLHSYSSKYNNGNPKFYRYTSSDSKKQPILGKTLKAIPETLTTEIAMASLLAFFRNAPKAFYNSVLGIYYEEDFTLLPETEVFYLDSLNNAILKNELLNKDTDELEIWKNKLKLTGKLPLKNAGEASLETIAEMVMPVKEQLSQLYPSVKETKIPIHIEFDDNISLVGNISGVYDHTLVSVCFSKNIKKHFLVAYIQAMAGRVIGVVDDVRFIRVDPKIEQKMETYLVPLSTINKDEALDFLKKLIEIYQDGMRKPFPFSDTIYYDMDFEKSGKLENNGLEDFMEKKLNNKNSIPDPYNVKSYSQGIWSGRDAVDAFQRAFNAIFGPIEKVLPTLFEKKKI